MAEELKQTINKVLQTKGDKRFHFGYATGKTTDGKAEGFLLVGKKKFKKEQAEKECETKDFFAGFCWSDGEGKTLYFAAKGKKLSKMVVTKMILSAKHQTGRRYEFELPSEDDEKKAEALAEETEGSETENEQEVPSVPPPPTGGTVPPPPPPAPPSGDLQGRLKALLLRLKFLLSTAPQLKAKLEPLGPATAAAVLKGGPGAVAALDALERALNTMGGPPAPGTAPPAPPLPTPDAKTPAPAKWQAVREAVVTRLRDLAKEVAAVKHAETQKAILEINAVMKNLTAKPESQKQVAELERWLQQDDVVADVCDLAFDLRTPLLKILAELKTQLSA